MAKQQRTWGIFIIQLALSIYMLVTGLCLTLKFGSSISSEEIKAVTAKFGSAGGVLSIIIGILLVICGVVFFVKAIGIDLGKFDDIIKYATLAVWIIVTIVTLIGLAAEITKGTLALHWLLVLAKNALIIGGILTIKNGK